MTTAIALDREVELRHTVSERDGVEPVLTIAGDTALASYKLTGEVRTDVWLWRDERWQLSAVHHSTF